MVDDPVSQMLMQRATDYSEWLKPAWWKLRARRRWRKYQSPAQVAAEWREFVKGEAEPYRRFGVREG